MKQDTESAIEAMGGDELRGIRSRLRMSQTDFGKVVGAHWTRVSAWERADKVPHHAALLARLMDGDPVICDRIETMVGLKQERETA